MHYLVRTLGIMRRTLCTTTLVIGIIEPPRLYPGFSLRLTHDLSLTKITYSKSYILPVTPVMLHPAQLFASLGEIDSNRIFLLLL